MHSSGVSATSCCTVSSRMRLHSSRKSAAFALAGPRPSACSHGAKKAQKKPHLHAAATEPCPAASLGPCRTCKSACPSLGSRDAHGASHLAIPTSQVRTNFESNINHGSRSRVSDCWCCCGNVPSHVGIWKANCQATSNAAQHRTSAPERGGGGGYLVDRPQLSLVSSFLRFLHGWCRLELFLPHELLDRTFGPACFGLSSQCQTTLRHRRPVVDWSRRFADW